MADWYEFIDKQEDFNYLVKLIQFQKYLPLDTETTGLDVLDENFHLLLLQLFVDEKAYVIDVRKLDLYDYELCGEIIRDYNREIKKQEMKAKRKR